MAYPGSFYSCISLSNDRGDHIDGGEGQAKVERKSKRKIPALIE
jgi:hypothetical protein